MNIRQILYNRASSQYPTESCFIIRKPEGYTPVSNIHKIVLNGGYDFTNIINNRRHVLKKDKCIGSTNNNTSILENIRFLPLLSLSRFIQDPGEKVSINDIYRDYVANLKEYVNCPNDRYINANNTTSIRKNQISDVINYRDDRSYLRYGFGVALNCGNIGVFKEFRESICKFTIIDSSSVYIVTTNRDDNTVISVVPIGMLVIKDEYVEDFKTRSFLDMDMDYSQFEYWVNADIDQADEYTINILKTVLYKVENPDNNIKFILKKNLGEINSMPIPSFTTITDRINWLSSIKNEYLNEYADTMLPVKDFEVLFKKPETFNGKVKYRNINKLISTNQLKSKFELV